MHTPRYGVESQMSLHLKVGLDEAFRAISGQACNHDFLDDYRLAYPRNWISIFAGVTYQKAGKICMYDIPVQVGIMVETTGVFYLRRW